MLKCIKIQEATKADLDSLKVIPMESYESVIHELVVHARKTGFRRRKK